MSKDAYYFSHDSNARNDEKILMLRAEHGWEGYGIFWGLIEMMFENEETAIKHKNIKGISSSFNIDTTLLSSIINTAITENLFVSDGEFFWSESLRKRKAEFHKLREKKSIAGKKGMEKRWGGVESQEFNNTVIADLYQSNNGDITEYNKGKESKVNENKLKGSIYTVEFEDFYAMYPNPFNKEQTFKNWKATLKKDTKENILIATENYIQYIKENNILKQYVVRSTNFIGNKQEYRGYLEVVKALPNGIKEIPKNPTRREDF